MNASVTLIPMILIRYGLLRVLNQKALSRAAFFPPRAGREKAAFYLYQSATILIFLYLFFLRIRTGSVWFPVGLAVYGLGIVFCAVSVYDFAKPAENGLNRSGLYRVSRNPMYVAYFIYLLGCVLLTRSLVLLALLIVFQLSAHWIILSEERWCIRKFGKDYTAYMRRVRRYI